MEDRLLEDPVTVVLSCMAMITDLKIVAFYDLKEAKQGKQVIKNCGHTVKDICGYIRCHLFQTCNEGASPHL